MALRAAFVASVCLWRTGRTNTTTAIRIDRVPSSCATLTATRCQSCRAGRKRETVYRVLLSPLHSPTPGHHTPYDKD
eukprot:54711-Eustigmatos_ZCMA.PRE.1